MLSGVYRPLHLAELQHALALMNSEPAGYRDPQPFDKEDAIPEDILTSVCLGWWQSRDMIMRCS